MGRKPASDEKSDRYLARVGPGLIAGASDDDPSAIATFTIAGATFGTRMLWTPLVTWPLMAAAQMMCARVGMITGRGIIGALRMKFPRPLLIAFAALLFVTNMLNIGADLSGMAEAAEMLTGVPSPAFVLLFGGAIAAGTVRLRYEHLAQILKWLAVALVAYPIAAFLLRPDWGAILRTSLVPQLPASRREWTLLIGIIGTTFSPYFLMWQASHEVEEKKQVRDHDELPGARTGDVRFRAFDVGVGTFFSRIVMFFIILTSALTLHRDRVTITSARQAAEALGPLSGEAAKLLYTAGLLSVGFLVIPVLSGSAAYALAEAVGWKQGLDEKLRYARKFYAVLILCTAGGMALELTPIQPMQALVWSGVINGFLAPCLLLGVLLVATDTRIMRGRASPRWERWIVALTIVAMLACTVMFFVP